MSPIKYSEAWLRVGRPAYSLPVSHSSDEGESRNLRPDVFLCSSSRLLFSAETELFATDFISFSC